MAKPFLAAHTDSILESVGTVSGNILLYASDADGDPLSVARVDGLYVDDTGKKGATTFAGTYGTLVIHEDGSYTYTLDPSLNIPNGTVLTDDFSIKIRDTTGLFSQNVLNVEITGEQNQRPHAVDDDYTTSGGTVSGNILANDYDPDGDGIHLSGGGAGSQAGTHIAGTGAVVIAGVYGTLTIDGTGAFTYTVDPSDPDYIGLGGAGGEEHFSYKISDGQPEKPNTDFAYVTIHFA